jgi:hypothetical protein
MVLQDLGRRISGAVHNLSREANLDEKASSTPLEPSPELPPLPAHFF